MPVLYHGLTLDTYCLLGELWHRERRIGRGCTVREASGLLECTHRAAAKILTRLVRVGHLEHDPHYHLPRLAKVYRAAPRWLKIVRTAPESVPGECVACGALSLPYPFEGRFLCRACMVSLNDAAEAEALIRALPLPDALAAVLDARPGYRHTAAGLREVLDGHPVLAPYGWMGREQLVARAMAALAASTDRYGTATDRLGRRYYWRTP